MATFIEDSGFVEVSIGINSRGLVIANQVTAKEEKQRQVSPPSRHRRIWQYETSFATVGNRAVSKFRCRPAPIPRMPIKQPFAEVPKAMFA